MSTTETDFEQLRATMAQGGVAPTLELLVDQLREQGKCHELFEARKMQVRHELGLPLLYGDATESLDEQQRARLEDGLLAACREVGMLLLERGAIQEGWMYLRPVGESAATAEALRKLEVDEDNMEAMINVTLNEGVDPERGFALVLEHYGTCNAITTFEQVMPHRTRPQQQVAARQLLQHLHSELLESVRSDITRQAGSPPAESTLGELLADRDWLFTEHTYHIDTTHLASVVRYSRLLNDAQDLRLALDLTEYGRRLSQQFQFAGEPPFEAMYPSHALFFAAQLGQQVDEAVAYFREQAETIDVGHLGLAGVDVYVDLLARLGRYDEAIDALVRLIPESPDGPSLDVARSPGWAPSLLELSELAGTYEPLMRYCLGRGDVLGYTTGLTRAGKQGDRARAK